MRDAPSKKSDEAYHMFYSVKHEQRQTTKNGAQTTIAPSSMPRRSISLQESLDVLKHDFSTGSQRRVRSDERALCLLDQIALNDTDQFLSPGISLSTDPILVLDALGMKRQMIDETPLNGDIEVQIADASENNIERLLPLRQPGRQFGIDSDAFRDLHRTVCDREENISAWCEDLVGMNCKRKS